MPRERESMSKVPYASAVGSLMYAMVCTRPDISQAISIVSRYMHAPRKEHWQAVTWILKYIHGTMGVELKFVKDDKLGLHLTEYVHSNYARDLDKRRPTTRYAFTLAKRSMS